MILVRLPPRNTEFVFLTTRYDERIREQFDDAPVVEVWTEGRVADWSGIPGTLPLDPFA